MKLTAKQREELAGKYGHCCAYCGSPLTARWQADHVQPVGRQGRWVTEGYRSMKFVQTGELDHPERDCIENLMPACIPCNNNKSNLSLETWRRILQDSAASLAKNYSRYKHALRFGLIVELEPRVIFHFERYKPSRQRTQLPKDF